MASIQIITIKRPNLVLRKQLQDSSDDSSSSSDDDDLSSKPRPLKICAIILSSIVGDFKKKFEESEGTLNEYFVELNNRNFNLFVDFVDPSKQSCTVKTIQDLSIYLDFAQRFDIPVLRKRSLEYCDLLCQDKLNCSYDLMKLVIRYKISEHYNSIVKTLITYCFDENAIKKFEKNKSSFSKRTKLLKIVIPQNQEFEIIFKKETKEYINKRIETKVTVQEQLLFNFIYIMI